MSSTVGLKYGTNNQTITITLNSLGSTDARQSTAIDNASVSPPYLDVQVGVEISTASSAVSATGYVQVYAYGTVNGGTNYTDGATGSDAAFTPTVPPNLRLIGVMNCVANSTSYIGGPFSVAAAFGGFLPDHWGIVIVNNTGTALAGSNNSAWYQGFNQSVG